MFAFNSNKSPNFGDDESGSDDSTYHSDNSNFHSHNTYNGFIIESNDNEEENLSSHALCKYLDMLLIVFLYYWFN